MRKKLLYAVFVLFFIFSSSGCDFFSPDKSSPPTLSEGIKYNEAEKRIKEYGFENISYVTIEDLIYVSDEDGIVEKVTYDGQEEYSAFSYFSKTAEVVIYYHTFSKEIKNYMSPNAYVDHHEFTDDDFKSLCKEIFKGFSICFEESGKDGSFNWSKIYFFNFDKNLCMTRYCKYGKGTPTSIHAYDIVGSLQNGWKTIKEGKIVYEFHFDSASNKIVRYEKEGNSESFVINKTYLGYEIEDIGHEAEIQCLGECDYNEGGKYKKIYKKFLTTNGSSI